MEFSNFFKVIKKHKFTLVLVPVFTVIITYFLVHNQPDVYTSQAKLATGIVDETQHISIGGLDLQESKINQQFDNLIEMLKSKRILDQLSYKLIIHDLSSNTPYRKPSALFNQLNASARKHALETFTNLYKKRQPLSLFNPDQNGMHKLLESMKYDDQSVLKSLLVYRVQSSDYINVQFDSEGAELSAVVVNTLCTEFVNYYSLLVKDNQRRSVDFLGKLLKIKEDTLNAKTLALKQYKIKNHVLNLNEKAKSLYGQMADFETRREEAERSAYASDAAINNIDKKFDPADRQYVESNKVAAAQKMLSTRTQLQAASDAYVQNNFDPRYKRKVDSLNNAITEQLGTLSDRYILSPLSTKKDLVDQKLQLQVQSQLSKNSSGAINKELNRLNSRFDALVPHEAATQALESAITIASQEYLEILQKYNQASLESNFATALRVVETAEPGVAQPSKKMLLVIISGVVSFVFCIAVLFILFFFDYSIKNALELADRTATPVLGSINLLHNKEIDLKALWYDHRTTDETRQLRNLIQSLRFEIETEMGDSKVLLINSIGKETGKSFIAINLAYAFASVSKKVLVIDGNFSDPGISRFTKTQFYLEDLLPHVLDKSFITTDTQIRVIGNKGGDYSLLEIGGQQIVAEKIAALKTMFDVIIIEASALDTLNQSKEWVQFSDKIITVFEAGHNITEKYKRHIQYLKQQNGKFIGWVINLVRPEKGEDN
jgi:succinoglycan biosynthesis transport protein ExoP